MKEVECPNTYLFCRKPLAKIYQLINDIDKNIDNNCGDQFDANYKHENNCKNLTTFALNHTCDDIYKIMDNMFGETGGKLALKNQILYNLSDLLKLKTKLKDTEFTDPFGSIKWWKKNIWTDNKFGNFIYAISSFISFVLFFYFTYHIYGFISQKLSRISVIITMILSIIITLLLISFIITNITNENEKSFEGVWSLIAILFGLTIIFWFISFKFKKNNLYPVVIIFLLPLLIAFNFYFSFFIPYLLLILILIQYITFSFKYGFPDMLLGMFILISIIMIIYTLVTQNSERSIDECTQKERLSQNIITYVFPYLIILITLIILYYLRYYLRTNSIRFALSWTGYLYSMIYILLN